MTIAEPADLLDLLTPEEGGRASYTPVLHIITPDFATLCRDDYLEAVHRGDRCSINPHLDDRDRVEPGHGRQGYRTYLRRRWHNITCPWCRALGHAYYRHACDRMQGRAP